MTQPSTPSPSPTTDASPSRRRRYEPKPRSKLQRVPISVWVLAPFLLASAAWFGWQAWQRTRTVVTFETADGSPVPALEIEVYPNEVAFNAPSPPPRLASAQHEGGTTFVLKNAGLPSSFLLRWSGAGVGAGVASVTRGRAAQILVTPPAAMDGRVGQPTGFLAFGLRTTGMRAVKDARVLCMGAGEHGVVLAETRTDAEGRFRLEGFASDPPVVWLRVLAPDCAIAFAQHFVGAQGPVVPLVPTKPLRGRVALPPEVDARQLLVLAKGLPGVQAEVAADGTFQLDHLPPNVQPRLLVHGLPTNWTHSVVNGGAGQENVVVEVVRGQTVRGLVLDRMTQIPQAGAMVWHDCGPLGGATVTTGEDGAFEFERLPEGKVKLRAQVGYTPIGSKELVPTGELVVDVKVSGPAKQVALLVD